MKRTIRLDSKLIEELSHLAIDRHGKLRGALLVEAETAIREYLAKNRK
jgi:hypothetical protein